MSFFHHFNFVLIGVCSLLPTTAAAKKQYSSHSIPLGQPSHNLWAKDSLEITEPAEGPSMESISNPSMKQVVSESRQLGKFGVHLRKFLLGGSNGTSPSASVSVLETSVETLEMSSGWVLLALGGLVILVVIFLLCWIRNKREPLNEGPSGTGVRRDVDLEQQLQEAIAAEDAALLAKLIQDAKHSAKGEVQVPETALAEAEAALQRLKAEEDLRRQLASAMARRDAEELRVALAAAELCVLSMPYLQKARNLLQELEDEKAQQEKPPEAGKE
jgi:hypothetical protein